MEIAVITAAVTLAELVTSNWLGPLALTHDETAVTVGVIMHVFILFALIFRGARAIQKGQPDLGIVLTFLSLAPLIRIVSVAVPLAFAEWVGFYGWLWIISVPLYLALFTLLRTEPKATTADLRVPRFVLQGFPLGAVAIAASIGFGLLEYVILEPATIEPRGPGFFGYAFAVGGLFFATGLFEEMLFRGVLQRRLSRIVSPWLSIVLISLLFAVLHIGNRSLPDLGLVFVIGLTYGWIVQRTATVVWVSIGHTVANVMLFMLGEAVLAG